MARYNETKLQAFLAEYLLNDLDIVVNVKTLATLLNKSEATVSQFITRMTPKYFKPYADSKKTHGCLFKYRVTNPKAKRVREMLCFRFLEESHMNLRKYEKKIDYIDFYIFEGIDLFYEKYDINLRDLIKKRYAKHQHLSVERGGYAEFFNKYNITIDGSTDDIACKMILLNYAFYTPLHSDILDDLIKRKVYMENVIKKIKSMIQDQEGEKESDYERLTELRDLKRRCKYSLMDYDRKIEATKANMRVYPV